MTTATPQSQRRDPDVERQRLEALRLGTEVRMAVASGLKDVKAGKLSAAAAFDDFRLRRATVEAILLAIPGFGGGSLKSLRRRCGVKWVDRKRIDELTDRQKTQILACVESPDAFFPGSFPNARGG